MKKNKQNNKKQAQRRQKNRKGYMGKGTLGKTPGAFKPTSIKKIRRQSRRTINKAYKPALHDVNREIKRTQSIDTRRQADERYYNEWLAGKQDQLRAHRDAATATMMKAQQDAQNNMIQSLAGMRQQILDRVGNETGTVSNMQDATAADATADADYWATQMGNSQQQTRDMIGTGAERAEARNNENFAQMQEYRNIRQGEMNERIRELSGEKTKIKLERAAAVSSEVVRRLTEEIDKAKARLDMRNMAASQALAKRGMGLEFKKYRWNKRLQAAQLNEEIRSNMANEQLTGASIRQRDADSRRDARTARNKKGRDLAQQRRKDKKAFNRQIQNGVEMLRTKPDLKGKSPARAVTRLMNVYKMEPVLARAAVALFHNGSLDRGLVRRLKQSGYDVPKRYR